MLYYNEHVRFIRNLKKMIFYNEQYKYLIYDKN